MKNFPHQINQIPKLAAGVRVFRDLIDGGNNINDDGIVGDALARTGVYSFRQSHSSIEEDLVIEHLKGNSSQGTRTCARDLRRMYLLLKFIHGQMVTANGEIIAQNATNPVNEISKSIWRAALNDLALEDNQGNISHPYVILLKLIQDNPDILAYKLALSLEAKDDSDEEYLRIRNFINTDSPNELGRSLGISEHQIQNAIKILPALAKQLGDVREKADRYSIALAERIVIPLQEPVNRSEWERRYISRNINIDIANRRATSEYSSQRSLRLFDPESTGTRKRAHEQLLSDLISSLDSNLVFYEGLFDAITLKNSRLFLFEVKTIRHDEAKQVRLGLGQLLYYKTVLIAPQYPGKEIVCVLVTDRKLSEDLEKFLIAYGIIPICILNANLLICEAIHKVLGDIIG